MNSDYLVGSMIENRYEVLEIIGSGGMATVYKAKCHVLNRYVAIKVLKASLKYDTEVVKKFNTESRAAAGLSHPNIVQVYDVGEGGNIDYIVMEYVDGITLKEYIQKKGNLEWQEACSYALQIARALECAHQNHVIHRDIKPHNVLVTKDGAMKVADFGIAQAAGSETLVAGGGMGSVHYISPEQARGGYTDERSDIYSLGVVLYEMLTGTVPFDGANPVAIALMKLEQEPGDCRIVNPNIPDKVAEIVMKAISKEQHLRYQSAADMAKDIESVLANIRTAEIAEGGKEETRRLGDTKMEYEKRRNSRRKKNTNVKLTVIGICIAAIIGFGTYFAMTGGRQEYQVPDLTDMTIEEAEEALKEAQLELDERIEFEVSDEFDEGHIISQKPGINQFVKKGRKIKVTVSSGLEITEKSVPDVENLKFEDAQKRLIKEGFEVKKVDKFSETIEYGYVIEQSPKAKTKAEEGAVITVYVSADVEDENEQAVVPKLTGYTEAKARELLAEAGLGVESVEREESQQPEGTVIAQTPAAKTGVEKGSKVSFVVSMGQKTESEPVSTPAPLKKKTLTITIPEDANDTVHIKVVANGKTIHDQNHAKSEGTVDIVVQSSKNASVQAYIDGKLEVDKTIVFE